MSTNIHFEITKLGHILKQGLPMVDFSLLMGSSAEGTVAAGSDLDLAFYLTQTPTLDFYRLVNEIVAGYLPTVRCDIGILNQAEPVFRFEALKGKLLFSRNMERYAAFFSLTCREYESQMADYARQHKYRLEAAHAL